MPGAAGASAVFTGRQRLALLAACALLMVARLPLAWLHGRFMGEEGTIFLAYAWHHPAAEALWRSFGGYLNLAANASTLLTARLVAAGVLPLETAPYLTMIAASLVQLVPAILILTARGRWLESRPAVIGALLILAVAPKTEEVFANILHIQFHLALAAALILALDPPAGRRGKIGYAAVLFLAPLCGPGSIILWPLFALRAAIERDPARGAQAAVFAAGIAIQLLVFFVPSPVRGHILDPVTLGAILFVRLVAIPIVVLKPGRAARLAHEAYLTGGVGWWLPAIAALVCFGVLVWVALRDRRDPAVWLIASGLTIAAVSFGGGMINSATREWFSVGAGERYNFLPLVLVGLGLIALARRRAGGLRRACVGLVTLMLLGGAFSYVKPNKSLAAGPSWPAEVALWRRDRDRPLASWPASWTVDLSDRDRPCPPPFARRDANADPTYCESHWLARVRAAAAKAAAGR